MQRYISRFSSDPPSLMKFEKLTSNQNIDSGVYLIYHFLVDKRRCGQSSKKIDKTVNYKV